MLASRTESALIAAVEDCGGGENLTYVKCDVTKRSEHEALLIAAIAKFGRVDVWVNNAGMMNDRNVLSAL